MLYSNYGKPGAAFCLTLVAQVVLIKLGMPSLPLALV